LQQSNSESTWAVLLVVANQIPAKRRAARLPVAFASNLRDFNV
jgi:hypothetical protein